MLLSAWIPWLSVLTRERILTLVLKKTICSCVYQKEEYYTFFYIEVYMDGIIMSFDAAGWRAPVHDLPTSVQARIQMEYFKLQYFQQ